MPCCTQSTRVYVHEYVGWFLLSQNGGKQGRYLNWNIPVLFLRQRWPSNESWTYLWDSPGSRHQVSSRVVHQVHNLGYRTLSFEHISCFRWDRCKVHMGRYRFPHFSVFSPYACTFSFLGNKENRLKNIIVNCTSLKYM